MTRLKWLFMSKIARLKYSMNSFYRNKQRFHFAGFVFDFSTMTIERDKDK